MSHSGQLARHPYIAEMAACGVMSTPGLVMGRNLVYSGKVLIAVEIGEIFHRM